MNRILRKVFINTCSKSRKLPENGLRVTGLEDSTHFSNSMMREPKPHSPVAQAMPKMLAVSILFAIGSAAWAGNSIDPVIADNSCHTGCSSGHDGHGGSGGGHENGQGGHGGGGKGGHNDHGNGTATATATAMAADTVMDMAACQALKVKQALLGQ